MTRKRVVVTGYSAITPLGLNAAESWEALLAGKSGIVPISRFDATEFDARIAGEVKGFEPEAYMPFKQAKRMDRFTQFAVAGAIQLLEHAHYEINDANAHRVAVMLGVGLGGLETLEAFHTKLVEAGPSRISPFYIPMLISNMAPGQVAIHTGAKGCNVVMTSACTSSIHAIGHAYTEVMLGRADAAITGGMEATITPMGISGFTALKALSSKRNDTPTQASRPFDADRDGFVMGEGAGMLLLESLDSALARGATIYAEVVGFGTSCDAYHMTAPHESGEGMAMAMKNAMEDAGVDPSQVTQINAHATSTGLNDACETRALHTVFGPHAKNLAICANKSQIGHMLGAAGGVESVFSVLTLHTGMVPGTLNLENPDPQCDLNYMADGPKKLDPQYVLNSSYGFGGTNGSLLFKKY